LQRYITSEPVRWTAVVSPVPRLAGVVAAMPIAGLLSRTVRIRFRASSARRFSS
jgi:hypothetical protein